MTHSLLTWILCMYAIIITWCYVHLTHVVTHAPPTIVRLHDTNCSRNFHDAAFFSVDQEHRQHLQELFDDLDEFIQMSTIRYGAGNDPLIEGNVGQLLAQMAAYSNMAHERRRVCEIGFNAGHSAIVFLLANDRLEYHGFTLDVPATRLGLEFVTTQFRNRVVNVTLGKSIETVVHARARLLNACDVLVIDGGHYYDVARADILNFRALATDDHVLIMDDIGCHPGYCHGPSKAWTEAINDGIIGQSGCWGEQQRNRRGFCFGKYLI